MLANQLLITSNLPKLAVQMHRLLIKSNPFLCQGSKTNSKTTISYFHRTKGQIIIRFITSNLHRALLFSFQNRDHLLSHSRKGFYLLMLPLNPNTDTCKLFQVASKVKHQSVDTIKLKTGFRS